MATTRYKVSILQVDDTELEYATEMPLDADRVFFDNDNTVFTSDNIQDALEEVRNLSPSKTNTGVYHWARNNATNGSYLLNYGANLAPSNKVGIPLFIDSPVLNELGVGNDKDNITFDILVYAHSGGALTLVYTQNVVLGVGEFTKNFIGLNIPIIGGTMLATQLVFSGFSNRPERLQVTAGVTGG
jgi:hypothetical protein